MTFGMSHGACTRWYEISTHRTLSLLPRGDPRPIHDTAYCECYRHKVGKATVPRPFSTGLCVPATDPTLVGHIRPAGSS
jgi:hypothetical protein